MTGQPVAARWDHTARYCPLVARQVPDDARVVLLDALAETRDLLAHREYPRRTQAWEPTVVAADPTLTWAQTRRLLHHELPGSRYRRRAL